MSLPVKNIRERVIELRSLFDDTMASPAEHQELVAFQRRMRELEDLIEETWAGPDDVEEYRQLREGFSASV